MAFVVKDRVKESSTTTGSGSYTLSGAEDGFQTFAAIGNGNTTYYAATDGTDSEVGVGTYTSSGTLLSRDTIISSSNNDAAVSWGAGEKLIFCSQPASKTNMMDDNGYVTGLEFGTHLDLNTTVATKPSHAEGRLFYDKAFGALGFYNEEGDITLQIGQEEYIRVYNDTGSTIANGKPVYLTGESGSTPTIAIARADGTYEQSQAVGIATHDIENSSVGYVTTRGLVADVDTSHLTVGDQVHVATGASGGTQTAAPTYPNYPTDVGICLISNASTGCIYVQIRSHSFETIRVSENSHFDADVTIDGDLTVNGTQTITNSNNIALSGSFNYFNSGDTITSPTFTGTGLDDMEFKGHYTGTTSNKSFYVQIDSSHGNDDTFKWSTDNFATTEATLVTITGAEQTLEEGISVKFNATSGHVVNDKWVGTASPSNVDTGIASNRNTGTSGVGYTHIGFYYDVSSNYWTLFDEYSPEPTGAIDVAHASFSYGTLKADTVIANVTGNLTGNSAGTHTGAVIGNVTGNVTSTGSNSFGSIAIGDWTITEDGNGKLAFSHSGTVKMTLDDTGTLAAANDIFTDETL